MLGVTCRVEGCQNMQIKNKRTCKEHTKIIWRERWRKRQEALGKTVKRHQEHSEDYENMVTFWQDRHPVKSLAEQERLDILQKQINLDCAKREPPPIRGYVHFGMLS